MSKSVAKLEARVATLKAQLAKAEAALVSATTVQSIELGTVVTFKYGRGETAVIKSGTVIGSKVAENGVTQLAVEIGEGFDKSVVRVAAAVCTVPVNQEGYSAE